MLAACAPKRLAPDFPLQPFQDMARKGICADTKNRLFLIDGKTVLWDRAGRCSDNAYEQVWFGSSPDQVICRVHDSIAGPRKTCDPSRAAEFDTMLENLGAPDLGLGKDHRVEAIPL